MAAVPPGETSGDSAPPYAVEDPQKVPGGPPPSVPPPGQPQAPFVQYPPGAVPPYIQPQVQYVIAPGVPAIQHAPKAPFPGPHTFLVYALIVSIICMLINPPSAIFAIPALVLATMSTSKKSSRQYPSASRLATYGMVLTTITLAFTLLSWLLYIGLIVGVAGRDTRATCDELRYRNDLGFSCYNNY